ncbi:SDR family NAD(P)-dependent oxidoreductase [Halodurantibacterium flavum]|uniref:SDR family NAD(P)-dependent oxidoreductase n=1 Tax=Halodurantibacterium flavum TaxID=1382802 RepID=A0ABW4S2E5_9RHOB
MPAPAFAATLSRLIAQIRARPISERRREAEFDRIFGVNVKDAVFTVQTALPLMGEGASIILTGSNTGVMGTPAFSTYSTPRRRSETLRQAGRWI